MTATHPRIASRAQPFGTLLLIGILTTGACGGGAPAATPAPSPAAGPPSATDSIRAEAANERIFAAASAGQSDDDASTAYVIGPEDQLDVQVFDAEDFSGPYRVDQSGRIALPLIGNVSASGRTTGELEDTLEARLAATYMLDPHVSVRVTEMQSHGVSVIGEVNQPGVYQVPGRSTLLEVLAEAEGLSPEAGSQVFVVRPSRPGRGETLGSAFASDGSTGVAEPPGDIIEVDLGALLESGRIDENVVVLPGDIVQVRPAGLVYVVGEVNRPGGFTVPPGRPVTVLQALAMAEGLADMASASDGMIVREHDDGSREEIPVNLEEVLEGSGDPPLLLTRDVLFVPRNGTKAFATGLVSSLVRMVTFRGLVY